MLGATKSILAGVLFPFSGAHWGLPGAAQKKYKSIRLYLIIIAEIAVDLQSMEMVAKVQQNLSHILIKQQFTFG